MWPYHEVSRAQFEQRKDDAERIFMEFGATPVQIELAYSTASTTFGTHYADTSPGGRCLYQYRNWYFRVDEVLFTQKPFLVFEISQNIEDVQNHGMEDADPFPYDLSEDEMRDEIRQMLEIVFSDHVV